MPAVPGKKEAPQAVLERAYKDAPLGLARVLPAGTWTQRGLLNAFCALDRLCAHLLAREHDGALVLLEDGVPTAVALLFEGHLVGANAARLEETTWGDAALLALMQGFVGGGALEVFALERRVVHALSGVGERAWKVQGGEDFSGVRALGNGYATLHFDGEVLGRIHTGTRENGAYPAVLRPARLNLPRIIGAWASERYAFTLRGRDAINPITDQYNRARATHGKPNVEVLAQLGRGKTPLEVATSLERDVAGLEGIIEAFLREGLLTHRRDPST
jgi:hypothetical protein